MMHYFVLTSDASHVTQGTFHECQCLAHHLIALGLFETLYIARSRAGELDASIIFEVTDGLQEQCRNVRRLSRQLLLQACKKNPFPVIGAE